MPNDHTPFTDFAEAIATPEPVAKEPDEATLWREKALRYAAEIENMRKRTEREITEAHTFAITRFARDLLGVQDNMHRALSALAGDKTDAQTIRTGIEMVAKQLTETFAKFGIEPIKTVGEKLNPDLHQAMNEVETTDQPAGHIVHELQAGYTLAGRLLRPALVSTAK